MKKLLDMTEPELRDLMQGVGEAVAHAAPQRAFIVLVTDFGETTHGGEAQYVSNTTDRATQIRWLRETADRLEAGQDYVREDGRG